MQSAVRCRCWAVFAAQTRVLRTHRSARETRELALPVVALEECHARSSQAAPVTTSVEMAPTAQ